MLGLVQIWDMSFLESSTDRGIYQKGGVWCPSGKKKLQRKTFHRRWIQWHILSLTRCRYYVGKMQKESRQRIRCSSASSRHTQTSLPTLTWWTAAPFKGPPEMANTEGRWSSAPAKGLGPAVRLLELKPQL